MAKAVSLFFCEGIYITLNCNNTSPTYKRNLGRKANYNQVQVLLCKTPSFDYNAFGPSFVVETHETIWQETLIFFEILIRKS